MKNQLCRVAGILPLLVLAGCFRAPALEPVPVPGAQPDGSWAVSCDGNGADWGECYRAAEAHCGGPYEVVRSLTRARDGFTSRAIVIRCERRAGEEPSPAR